MLQDNLDTVKGIAEFLYSRDNNHDHSRYLITKNAEKSG